MQGCDDPLDVSGVLTRAEKLRSLASFFEKTMETLVGTGGFPLMFGIFGALIDTVSPLLASTRPVLPVVGRRSMP